MFCLQAFNPETEFQFKNRGKHWDKKYYEGVFGADDCYALCPPSSAYYTSPSYKVLGEEIHTQAKLTHTDSARPATLKKVNARVGC